MTLIIWGSFASFFLSGWLILSLAASGEREVGVVAVAAVVSLQSVVVVSSVETCIGIVVYSRVVVSVIVPCGSLLVEVVALFCEVASSSFVAPEVVNGDQEAVLSLLLFCKDTAVIRRCQYLKCCWSFTWIVELGWGDIKEEWIEKEKDVA